jgi:hypothetical protein
LFALLVLAVIGRFVGGPPADRNENEPTDRQSL